MKQPKQTLTIDLTPTERAYLRLKAFYHKFKQSPKYTQLKELYRKAMDSREFELAECVREWSNELYGN